MRVDFYLLGGSHRDPLKFTCALIGKAWPGVKRIAVVGPRAALTALDERLWHEPRGRFIPHDIDTGPAPILLLETAPERADILINLDGEAPLPRGDFARVVEIVPQDEQVREILRKRWLAWKQKGADIQHHALK